MKKKTKCNEPTTESILAAMRDAIKSRDELIIKFIYENIKLKEGNDRAWAIFDRLAREKEGEMIDKKEKEIRRGVIKDLRQRRL